MMAQLRGRKVHTRVDVGDMTLLVLAYLDNHPQGAKFTAMCDYFGFDGNTPRARVLATALRRLKRYGKIESLGRRQGWRRVEEKRG